jgi:NADPH:quinone reductase-like Zn-dependent oxidoreductase
LLQPAGLHAGRERILDLTGGRGADVFCDPVGGELFDISLRTIAQLGRVLVIGFTSSVFPVVRANIQLIKAASVIGANYGHFLSTQTAQARVQVERMLGWIAAGSGRYRVCQYKHRRRDTCACVTHHTSSSDGAGRTRRRNGGA